MDDNSQIEHRSRLEPIKRGGQYPVLRNWLNAIFMIGALIGVAVFYWSDNTVGTIIILIGVAVFYWSDNTVGTIIILASMVFKIIECGLRFLK